VCTEKFDGTCCAVWGGVFYKRLALKEGRPKPAGWIHWREALGLPDPSETGHGWAPVIAGPDTQYHMEAWASDDPSEDGTYELVGPKIQRNPYKLEQHELWLHGSTVNHSLDDVVLASFDEARVFLDGFWLEGVVWHHPDGRMAKLKRRDFGIPWPGPR
jgi:hypothetical protein